MTTTWIWGYQRVWVVSSILTLKYIYSLDDEIPDLGDHTLLAKEADKPNQQGRWQSFIERAQARARRLTTNEDLVAMVEGAHNHLCNVSGPSMKASGIPKGFSFKDGDDLFEVECKVCISLNRYNRCYIWCCYLFLDCIVVSGRNADISHLTFVHTRHYPFTWPKYSVRIRCSWPPEKSFCGSKRHRYKLTSKPSCILFRWFTCG